MIDINDIIKQKAETKKEMDIAHQQWLQFGGKILWKKYVDLLNDYEILSERIDIERQKNGI
jgi:hypothetical protein